MRKILTGVFSGKETSVWLAWFENVPDERISGRTEQEATLNLLHRINPRGLHWEFNGYSASDEGPWSCRHYDWPGLIGIGSSWEGAEREWEKQFSTTWHRNRLRILFTNMVQLAESAAKAASTREAQNHGSHILREVTAFIQDWYDEKIGVLRR